jgi:hypothetical protein
VLRALLFAVALFALLGAAQVTDPQPRTLGNTAAMHVYYYAPKTLEITYVDTYLFADVDKCKDAVPKAAMIATPHASEGDLVDVQCVAMHPPEVPKEKAPGATGI